MNAESNKSTFIDRIRNLQGQDRSDSKEVLQILSEFSSGRRLTRDEGILLYNQASLKALQESAHKVRNELHPNDKVGFLIDRNINYTNVCNSNCSFCGFYRHSSEHPEAYVLSKDIIADKINEALDEGATRILLQGGHNDDLPWSFYTDLLSWISANFKIEINAFSPSEIKQMVKVSGLSATEVLLELKRCGLKSLSGGGAEILDDEVRRRVSPLKISADEWIEMMRIAQSIGLSTTATMVIGFGESIENRFNHFDRLRDLQDWSKERGFKGFSAFIAWPLQTNENTSLGRSRHKERYGADAAEYLRIMAVARLYLDNIPHMQSSWPTLGAEVAQYGLYYGCDDIGSTMMEENVVSQAGALTAKRWSMTADELKQYIKEAGFKPVQRDSSFEVINADC